jgi:RNA polymerase sigma-70 factor (ECF subfamily)
MAEAEHSPAAGFPTTHWSRVARAGELAGPEGRAALEELCAAYWYPIYALIRGSGHGEADALDLTQEYFARLLERPVLAAADPVRGRFRSFLRADCGRFLIDARRRARAQRRGGGGAVLSIDARDAEGRYLREPADDTATLERLFDHAWATTLLDDVLVRLRREYEGSGRGATFEALKVALTDGARAVSHRVLAERLGVTEGAAQVAVHRLRRYRNLVREAIAETVTDPADIEDEIRELFAALGG